MGLLVEDLLTLARLDQQRPLDHGPGRPAHAGRRRGAGRADRRARTGRSTWWWRPATAFLVDGDEPRLRQVIGNLVNNALTHTPPGTPVRVKIAAAR